MKRQLLNPAFTSASTFASLLSVALWALILVPAALQAASEKGPRCNDGIDNDGDGLVDCADPDCNCGGDGGDGSDGGGSGILCVTFDDLPGDSLRSDGLGSYCHDQKAKLVVSFTNDGHLELDTNSSSKANDGRSLFVDFGETVTITDPNGDMWSFRTTDDLMTEYGISHDVRLFVGGFQDDFNMLQMFEGETREDVNLSFTMTLHIPGVRTGDVLFVKLAPIPLENLRHCEPSDPVTVKCLEVDGSGIPMKWEVYTTDPSGSACVSEDPYGQTSDELTVGLREFVFSFVVSR